MSDWYFGCGALIFKAKIPDPCFYERFCVRWPTAKHPSYFGSHLRINSFFRDYLVIFFPFPLTTFARIFLVEQNLCFSQPSSRRINGDERHDVICRGVSEPRQPPSSLNFAGFVAGLG